MRRFLLSVLVLALVSAPVIAHPGHDSALHGFGAGFTHPMLGFDHVVAMVAVGLWACLLGGSAIWIVPVAFVVCMVGGFAIALVGISLPVVQPAIAASVLILGLLIGASRRLPLTWSVVLVGIFAAFHGHAHGSEIIGAVPAFGFGFVAATILLHASGIGVGRLLIAQRHLVLARGVGAVIAGIGAVLLGGWI